jgi:hypothetical protein
MGVQGASGTKREKYSHIAKRRFGCSRGFLPSNPFSGIALATLWLFMLCLTSSDRVQINNNKLVRLCLRGGMQTPTDFSPGCRLETLVWKERPVPDWAFPPNGSNFNAVSARILELTGEPGKEHTAGKPRGCAVVIDPERVRLSPFWNEEILDDDFPRWQDGSAIDEVEYRRCGAAGYPFHVWLRKLLPAGSHVWQPLPSPSPTSSCGEFTQARTEGAESTDAGASGSQDSMHNASRWLRIGGLSESLYSDVLKQAAPGRKGRETRSKKEKGFTGPGKAVSHASVVGGARRSEEEEVSTSCSQNPGRHDAKLVFALNSVQSNFMAPYDFVVVDGQVVRQKYAVTARPLTATLCWVFQIAGRGPPRIVRLQIGNDDKIFRQAQDLTPQVECWEQATVRTGVSGVPILLNGANVCTTHVKQRIAGMPIFPNTVTWDPATTRAAFTGV